jgi:hypothetical protein
MFSTKLANETRRQGGEPMFFMDWNTEDSPMNAENVIPVDRAYSYVAGYEHAYCAPFGLVGSPKCCRLQMFSCSWHVLPDVSIFPFYTKRKW